MSDSLQVEATDHALVSLGVDTILVPVIQDGELSGTAARLNDLADGLITDMRQRREFTAELGQTAILPAMGHVAAARVLLVGLGKAADAVGFQCGRAVSAACRTAGRRGLPRVAAAVEDWPLSPQEASRWLSEGAEFSRYVPDPYRTGERHPTQVVSLTVAGGSEADLREGLARGIARNLARNLANEPSNVLDPPELARRAEAMAAEVGLEFECLDVPAMEKLGMGALLAVTQGSEIPARFIILRHRGAAPEAPTLALIGKAVTFDTGGISLKPSADMGRMKGDMAGGAAVIGAMRAIAQLQIPANVLGLVPASMNMPDGRAWRPGDVITSMDGKTIETISTDAEGRMLLADAITYARGLGVRHIVDIATLTGACAIALGQVASGLYGTDAELVEKVRSCGEAVGERHWPMPLFPEYRELIRSEIGDLKNSGGRLAGSVTAAMFLREFARDTSWAHLDVAGSAHNDKPRPWMPSGPTGTGVGTFIDLARALAT